MPQLSKRTFDETKRYETIVFQEGTHPADFEMVELQDWGNSERRALIRALLTDGAIGDGFLVVGSGLANAVNITPGATLSQGQRLLLPDVLHQTIGGAFVYNMPVAIPVVDRTDLIYLVVGVNDVTSTQDPDIEDPTLGPGAYREQVTYKISLAQGTSTIPALPQGQWGVPLAAIARHSGVSAIAQTDVTDVRLVAALNTQFTPKNLIIVSSAGGRYHDVQAALDSITGSSQTNQFIVFVGPGTYASTVPITMSKPFVTLMGIDPMTTTIKVLQAIGDFSAVTVSAPNMAIMNLGLDIGSNSAGNTTVVSVAADIVSVSVENCLVGQQSFGDSTVPNVQGIVVGTDAALSVTGTSVWAKNYGAGLNNESGTVVASGLSVTALDVDALVSSGPLTIASSTILSNNRSLNSTGQVTATSTTFTTATVSGTAVSGANCMSLGGAVAVKMIDCEITSTINAISASAVSLAWENVAVDAVVYLSGSGSSTISQCSLTGFEATGTTVQFLDCAVQGGTTTVPTAGTANMVIGLAIRSGTACTITSCTNAGANAVTADASSPVISNCSFSAVGAVDAIDVANSANPIISNSTFSIGVDAASASASAINILDTASNLSVVYNFFQGPASGPTPTYFINGVAGSRLLWGDNTASRGITLFNPAITATTLITTGRRHTDLTDMPDTGATNSDHDTKLSLGSGGSLALANCNKAILASTTMGQGASLVGVQDAPDLFSSTTVEGALVEAGTVTGNLRVLPTATPGNTVRIMSGTYLRSTGAGYITYGGGTTGSFTAPVGGTRIDLITLTDTAGTALLGVVTGTPGGPAPAYPPNILVLAEITIPIGGPVVIDAANIRDVRPFLRSDPIMVTGTPTAGQVPVAASGTAAAWGTIIIPVTGTPTLGQVPIASSGTTAAWGALISSGPNDVTVSRLLGTTYTNGTSGTNPNGNNRGTPAFVSVTVTPPQNGTATVTVRGVVIGSLNNGSGPIQFTTVTAPLFFIVLPNQEYYITAAGATLVTWIEWY